MQQGNGLQSPLRPLSVLFFHLLLAYSCTGQSQLIAPSQPIVAKVGDDIILPCHLETEVDVVAMTLEWTRSDLNPRFVHMRRAGQDLVRSNHPSYKGRTSVSIDELKHGNVSLKLSKVKPSDTGRYQCYIPKLDTGAFVELVVGAASSLVISLSEIDRNKGAVVLQCESTGWYPEPEVFWLDAEGNLLSAGPTETVRGPDDLYTVSSRVTVEKRHSNSFTCRVQQKKANLTRETITFISDDFFEVQSSSSSTTVGLVVILAVCILVILILVFFVWRQNKNTKRRHSDETDKVEKNQECEPLTTEERKPMKSKLKEEQQKLKEEQQRRQEAENKAQALEEELEKKTREEQQTKEAAEKILKLLKEELETKKTELQKKQADLQQLHEEKQRKEKNLQRLKEHLENKNTEVETLGSELTQYSRFPFSSKKGKEQMKKEAEKEVENLKKQLETHQTELDNKTKEFNFKQVEVQQLQEEIQRMETDLKTLMEELSNNKEMMGNNDETNRKLLQEAQKEVGTLKSQLESKKTESERMLTLRQKIQEELQKRKEAEKTLEEKLLTKTIEFEKKQAEVQQLHKDVQMMNTGLQSLMKDLDSDDMKDLKPKVTPGPSDSTKSSTSRLVRSRSVPDQSSSSLLKWPFILRQKFQEKLQMKITEFEKKQAEVQQLHEDVQMMNTGLQSLMKDLDSDDMKLVRSRSVPDQSSSSLSGSNTAPPVQSDAVQPVSLSQWPEMLRKKFQEKLKMKNTERESKQQDSSNPVSQSSTTEPTVGVKFDPRGEYIQLKNTSTEDQQLGGWDLQIQVNNYEPIKHTFEDSFSLKPGKLFTVGCRGYSRSYPPADLVLKDLISWNYGDQVQVSLISCPGKIQYNLDRIK